MSRYRSDSEDDGRPRLPQPKIESRLISNRPVPVIHHASKEQKIIPCHEVHDFLVTHSDWDIDDGTMKRWQHEARGVTDAAKRKSHRRQSVYEMKATDIQAMARGRNQRRAMERLHEQARQANEKALARANADLPDAIDSIEDIVRLKGKWVGADIVESEQNASKIVQKMGRGLLKDAFEDFNLDSEKPEYARIIADGLETPWLFESIPKDNSAAGREKMWESSLSDPADSNLLTFSSTSNALVRKKEHVPEYRGAFDRFIPVPTRRKMLAHHHHKEHREKLALRRKQDEAVAHQTQIHEEAFLCAEEQKHRRLAREQGEKESGMHRPEPPVWARDVAHFHKQANRLWRKDLGEAAKAEAILTGAAESANTAAIGL
jgi:hypothetical protein